MRINEIKDIKKLKYIVENLFNVNTIKVIDIRKKDIKDFKNKENNEGINDFYNYTLNKLYNYIHFDIDILNTIGLKEDEVLNYNHKINIMYACTHINDEIDDPQNDKYVEIHGINPNAIIQGPIKYKDIEEIYRYLDGPDNTLLDDDDIYFCFGDTFKKILKKKYFTLNKKIKE